MVVAVTGHRPDKLYGYDMTDIRYRFLVSKVKEYLKSVHCTEAITGMALGADLIFAQAVLELKEEGIDVKLTCAIPCLNHKAKWIPSRWTGKYDEVQKRADNVIIISERLYDNTVMQIRNKWMVDRCDKILAIFNGSSGGTKNCVDYAREKGKPIDILNPYDLSIAS